MNTHVAAALERLSLALSLLCTMSVHAQGVTTDRLMIKMDGDCENITHLSVVIQGRDGEEQKDVTAEKPCKWTVETTRRFSTDDAFFSLRVDRARTECMTADIAKDETPKLTYTCCNFDTMNSVTVTTDSTNTELHSSYLREVLPVIPDRPPLERRRPCVEFGILQKTGIITHVQLNAETIYLQVGHEEANTRLLGLRLNDLPDLQKKDRLSLSRDDVVYRFSAQRAKGKDKSASSLAPNAIDLDLSHLKHIKLDHLEIWVN